MHTSAHGKMTNECMLSKSAYARMIHWAEKTASTRYSDVQY